MGKEITFNGKTQNIKEWAKDLGISSKALRYRLKNWTLGQALTTKAKEPKN